MTPAGPAAEPGVRTGGGADEAKGTWVGRPLSRVEDGPLLRGEGAFTGDRPPPGTLHVAFVRSTHACGVLRATDVAPALEVAGVRAVLRAGDVPAGGLRARLDRPGFVETEMPLLAAERVRHVGEPVAMVLADSPYAAEDGAAAVRLDVDPAPAVASLAAATAEGAARVHDAAAGNVLLESALVDDPAMDELLTSAAHVVEVAVTSGRLTAVPLEGRATLAEWDAREGRLRVTTSTQVPHLVRTTIADLVGLPEGAVHVIAPDVGGGFGQKCVVAREEVLLAAAARHLRVPVLWVEDRAENLVASFHGHEQQHTLRGAFDADGRLLGVDARIDCDVGAYSCFPFSCAVEPLMAASELPGPYRFERYRVRSRAITTNKAPMAPYRGVSRPQITLALEQLMDRASDTVGCSRRAIRERNLIRRSDFPHRGPSGIGYDEGSYSESLAAALAQIDEEAFVERQRAARAEGRLLGLGVAVFSERTGYGTPTFAQRGMAVTPGFDGAELRMDPSGTVRAAVGVSAHGQGHRTTLAQVVADGLGLNVEDVRVVQGDTDATPYGWGTFASRSAVIGGGACALAAAQLAAKLRRIAAASLGVAPEEVRLVGRHAEVADEPARSVPIAELARRAHHAAHELPAGEEPGLVARAGFDPPGTFSNATHAVTVEVDPETGGVAIERYVVVEDCGVMLNPLVVDGQVRGGVPQGIAAALYEELPYGPDGQPQASTLIDYLVPTAAEIPDVEITHLETPSAHSVTGAKGMGEGGTIGAPAAVLGAINDALAPLGARVTAIPASPARVRQAVVAASQGPDAVPDRLPPLPRPARERP